MKTYIVGVFYQTPSGRCGAQNFRIEAKNEDDAMKKGRKIVRQRGKGYKIEGGDAVLHNKKRKRRK